MGRLGMAEGVTWNLVCPQCEYRWMGKVFSSEAECPVCKRGFTIGYKPISREMRAPKKPRGALPEGMGEGPQIPKGSGTTKKERV